MSAIASFYIFDKSALESLMRRRPLVYDTKWRSRYDFGLSNVERDVEALCSLDLIAGKEEERRDLAASEQALTADSPVSMFYSVVAWASR